MWLNLTSDPWFWISAFFFSGWVWFLRWYSPRHYWRIPPSIRRRAVQVLNRPIYVDDPSTPTVYADLDQFCQVAVCEWLETLGEAEAGRRAGFAFVPRRNGLDS